MVGPAQDAEVGARRAPYHPVGAVVLDDLNCLISVLLLREILISPVGSRRRQIERLQTLYAQIGSDACSLGDPWGAIQLTDFDCCDTLLNA